MGFFKRNVRSVTPAFSISLGLAGTLYGYSSISSVSLLCPFSNISLFGSFSERRRIAFSVAESALIPQNEKFGERTTPKVGVHAPTTANVTSGIARLVKPGKLCFASLTIFNFTKSYAGY